MDQPPARPRLDAVRTVHLTRTTLHVTVDALRDYGRQQCEGLVLWVGRIEGDRAIIEASLVPEQNAIRSESGVGYFVEGPELFAINRMLSERKLRLLAQVHSHPTEAYHSSMDDRYALVTTEGGYSLVVPYFARGRAALEEWAVYRLREGRWTELSPREVGQTFVVV
jgi:hypothetical protein